MDICPICEEPLTNGQNTIKVTKKGSEGISRASEKRKRKLQIPAGQSVHEQCRHDYCNKHCIARDLKQEQNAPSTSSPCKRRSQEPFRFAEQCLFCAQPANLSGRRKSLDVYPVRTSDFQPKIKSLCKERGFDSWALKVQGRIEFAQDLHAADAIYHQDCSTNFRTGKSIPVAHQLTKESRQTLGRPLDSIKEEAFQRVVRYLEENDDEQTTISDLVKKMQEYSKNESESFTVKHMKRRLEEYFGNSIVISNINGKADVVTFRSTAAVILQAFYDAPKLTDAKAEEMRIIKTAQDLIKNDIKCMATSKEMYPIPEDIASIEKNIDYVPESLRCLLRTIF